MENLKSTTNYSMFKPLRGNRPIREIHVRRIMDSLRQYCLPIKIIINEHFEVIDGQHRLEAARRLSLPVEYEVRAGYGLKEAQIINQNVKTWGKVEFLDSYCTTGFKPYLQMREFMQQYPAFGIAAAETILTNTFGGINNKRDIRNNGKIIGKVKNFEGGNLEISDLPGAYETARKIMEYKEFYGGYNRVLFVRVMVGLFKNPDFDHSKMINKLRLQPTALKHCQNVEQYKLLIEKIYNFKSQHKISLIY